MLNSCGVSDKSWFYAAQSKGKVDKVDIEILSLGPKNWIKYQLSRSNKLFLHMVSIAQSLRNWDKGLPYISYESTQEQDLTGVDGNCFYESQDALL